MRALVTGGAGFIGSHIVRRFLSNGYDVTILDSLEETSDLKRLGVIPSSTRLIKERIENVTDLPKVDLVINSAAETHVDYSFERPMDFINANIIGLHNLAKHCSENNIPLIHLSTDEVIGTGEDLHEDSMLKPTNPYAFTKCAGENLLHSYGYSYGLNWKVVRLNNIYGLWQFPDKLIPKFIYHIEDGEKVPIHGNGLQTRNFLNVEDFVDALELVWLKGKDKNIYNVSTAEEYPIIDVTKMICDVMDVSFKDSIEYVEDRLFNDPCYHSKGGKIRKLGWKPKHTLKSYLPTLVKWYTNNRNYFLERNK